MRGLRPLQRYFEFSGRSGRAEYWQWIGITTLTGLAIRAFESVSTRSYDAQNEMVSNIFILATFVPGVAVAFRRLHDRGKSGWLFTGMLGMLALVVLCGIWATAALKAGDSTPRTIFVILVSLLVAMLANLLVQFALPGDVGNNVYGPPDDNGLVVASNPTTLPPTVPTSQFADATLIALERLAELKRQGLLSDEEFGQQKQRVFEKDAASIGIDKTKPR